MIPYGVKVGNKMSNCITYPANLPNELGVYGLLFASSL